MDNLLFLSLVIIKGWSVWAEGMVWKKTWTFDIWPVLKMTKPSVDLSIQMKKGNVKKWGIWVRYGQWKKGIGILYVFPKGVLFENLGGGFLFPKTRNTRDKVISRGASHSSNITQEASWSSRSFFTIVCNILSVWLLQRIKELNKYLLITLAQQFFEKIQ